MGADLSEWVEQHVGPHALLRQHSRHKRDQAVLEVLTADGERIFAKQVRQERHWTAERRAYRNWTLALRGRTPRLLAANRPMQSLLLSSVPGSQPHLFDLVAHREAGHVLRMIHESRPPRRGGPPVGVRVAQKLEFTLSRTSGLLRDDETRFAREQAGQLGSSPLRDRVPCHGDYRPHNWIVDDDGVLRVIDFGEARWHVPVFDLTRLSFGVWWDRPDLYAAFLEGYGREPDDAERHFVRLHLVITGVVAIAYAREHGLGAREAFARERLRQLMEGHPGVAAAESTAPGQR
jgi:aminoglycoside phosphotransferase